MTKVKNLDSITRYIPTVNENFITTVAGTGVSAGAAVVPLTSVADLIDGSVFVGIVEPGETNEQVFTGTVDLAGSRITDVNWTRGTDTAHAAGVTVVDYITSTAFNMFAEAFLKEHADGGTHKAITTTTVTASGLVQAGSANVTGAATVTGNLSVGKVQNRVQTLASGVTLTPNADTATKAECSALAVDTTIAAPTGSPTNLQSLELVIYPTTAVTLAWNAVYVSMDAPLPTSLSANKAFRAQMEYSSNRSRWEVLSWQKED